MKAQSFLFLFFSGVLFFGCTKEPEADFTINFQNSNRVPSSVYFHNLSSDADSYVWDFGDGRTSTETSPTHVFDRAGNFNVKLTANNHSKKSECIKAVTILDSYNNGNSQFYFAFILKNQSGQTIFDVKAYCFDQAGEDENLNLGTILPGAESPETHTGYYYVNFSCRNEAGEIFVSPTFTLNPEYVSVLVFTGKKSTKSTEDVFIKMY